MSSDLPTAIKKTQQNLTETELIKQVVAKRNYQIALDLYHTKGVAQAREMTKRLKGIDRQSQVKSGLRIW